MVCLDVRSEFGHELKRKCWWPCMNYDRLIRSQTSSCTIYDVMFGCSDALNPLLRVFLHDVTTDIQGVQTCHIKRSTAAIQMYRNCCQTHSKTPLINTFILAVNLMTLCNVTIQPSLIKSAALSSILASFCSSFCFYSTFVVFSQELVKAKELKGDYM